MPGIGARSDETIRHEASDWVAQVHDPDAAVDRAAFERWRSADPRHGQAYARAERAWDQAALVAQTSFGRARRLPARRRWFEGTQIGYAFAAAAVLVIALVGLTVIRPFGASVEPTELASRVGEIRKVALADGSTVTLDTDSELRVAFSRGERDLVLVRGRARFEVAHDAARPFVVTAAGASVTARGTIFDVSLRGGNVQVALLRGSVDVRGGDNVGHAPSGPIARLKPGQQVVFVSSTSPPSPQPAEAGASEWTGGMLSFDRTRLGDAIVEANRYSTDKIAVADPALNDLRITGAYHVGDAQGLAASMAASLGLRAVRTPRGDVLIVASPPTP